MRPADGWTKLHSVAAWGDPAEAKALVVAGADLSTRDSIGRSVLHIAAGYGNTVALREFIALGADPSARTNAGLTPLHYSEDLESTRTLIAAGADPDARDEDGDTPLHDLLAGASLRPREAVSDYPELVKVLLAAGADPNVRNDPSWGTALVSTPLHEAAESSHPELVEVVKMLLAAGADLNEQNGLGYTPLDRAAYLRPTGIGARAHRGRRGPEGTRRGRQDTPSPCCRRRQHRGSASTDRRWRCCRCPRRSGRHAPPSGC